MLSLADSHCEVYLQPGEVFFGDASVRVRTVLGSCVSITLWHPQRHLGGMCHYMLPERPRPSGGRADGRYGPEAWEILLAQARAAKTQPGEYQAKIFGGGRMFAGGERAPLIDIGQRNIDVARRLLAAQGMQVTSEHFCGDGHRCLLFDIATGDVWVKHLPQLATAAAVEIAAKGMARLPLGLPGNGF